MEDHGRIRVLLADDHRIFREALRMLLANECEVIAEASDGEQAVALALRLKPQVVVMDIGMRGIGGLSAARRIAKEAPSCQSADAQRVSGRGIRARGSWRSGRRGLRGQDRRVG